MADTSIQEVVDYLHGIAPPHLQESYDNAGLIVGRGDRVCTGVITCLDSTEAVIDEAINTGANLVVAHHPIVFKGLKRFNGTTYIERVVMKAISNNIAILAIHTNLDNVHRLGVNQRIADRLGLQETRILAPKNPENETIGSGLIGILDSGMEEIAFLQHLKKVMGVSIVKYTPTLGNKVTKVAICGGSGGFLLSAAIQQKADIFVTADYKYHEYFDANGHIIIADIGHYESEQYTSELLQELISEKFSTFAARCTKVVTNPVKYL